MSQASQSDEEVLKALGQQLKPFTGGELPVQITLHQGDANGAIKLGDAWRIHPTDELMRRLIRQFSCEHVELVWR
jgi:DNA polymerase-3 subunit alpha